MRPSPSEIITCARSLLKDHVAGELSAEAQVHFRRVMSALRDSRWDDAAFDLLRQNQTLAELIGKCLDGRSDAALPEAIDVALRAALVRQAAGLPGSFAEANEINRALRAALAALIEAMRDGMVVDDTSLAPLIVSTALRLQDAPPSDPDPAIRKPPPC